MSLREDGLDTAESDMNLRDPRHHVVAPARNCLRLPSSFPTIPFRAREQPGLQCARALAMRRKPWRDPQLVLERFVSLTGLA